MKSLDDSVSVIDLKNASFFAEGLFFEAFASAFPIPKDTSALPVPTPARNWHQYVAFYKWSDKHIEPIGFCNWIRYGDIYLEGGMCVSKSIYRRLPGEHWAQCKARGGIAQIMMEAAERELNDCDAWFGYCGDKKAFIVDSRVGYRRTSRQFLIVKWFREVSDNRKRELEDMVAAIGPF